MSSTNVRKVRIISDGTARGTTITDPATGQNVADAFAFQVRGSRMSCVTKAAIFVHVAEVDLTTDAEIVPVSSALLERAAQIAEKYDSDQVREALRDLIGCDGHFRAYGPSVCARSIPTSSAVG